FRRVLFRSIFYSSQTQSNSQLSTLESLLTLIYLNDTVDVNLSSAMEYLVPSSVNNSTEHLAKVVLVKHGLGADYASELLSLVERQMPYSGFGYDHARSEEHTSELQSRENLVCRLLL